MIIELKNISFIYQKNTPFENQALFDIDLNIKKGEIAGIIGPTGSGKSTLIQLFNGLLEPSSGDIIICEKSISGSKKKDASIRFDVGLVFQYPEYQLFEETVYDDVAFGPRNMKLPEDEVKARVKIAIEQSGLDYEYIKNRSPLSLSGGEMRRVALAGILSMQPQILVLDEPTAGLDPRGRSELISMLKHFNSELGMTIIIVSHEMKEVAALCNHLIVMNKGRIAADGTPAEIFKNKKWLREIGLDIPIYMELAEKLAEKGIKIKADALDINTIKNEILNLPPF